MSETPLMAKTLQQYPKQSTIPTGDSLIADRVYRGSKVTISSNELEADLIVLDIHDFDIILVMDWLAKHRATVDCYRKEV